jgi:hypothetical protein
MALLHDMLAVCHQCKATFVFDSDADDHKARSGHLLIIEHDILSGKNLA